MAGEVRERCLRLSRRLEKEIARGPLPSKDRGDTSAVGGWGKIGMDLEAVASALFCELVSTGGFELADAKREYGVFRKPTVGQWLEAVVEVGRVASSRGEISSAAKVLLGDLRKDKMSTLFALADVRNRLQHDVVDRPTANEATNALQRALTLLGVVTR